MLLAKEASNLSTGTYLEALERVRDCQQSTSLWNELTYLVHLEPVQQMSAYAHQRRRGLLILRALRA